MGNSQFEGDIPGICLGLVIVEFISFSGADITAILYISSNEELEYEFGLTCI